MVLPGILNATTDRLLTCALELDPQGMRTIVVIPPTDPRDVVPGFDPLPVLCQRYLNRLRHGFFVITEVKSSSPDQGHVNADGVRVVMRVDYHLNNRDNVLAEPVPHSVPQVVPPIVSTTYGGEALCQWLSDVLIRHASYYYAESLHRLKVVMSDNEDLTTLVGPPRPEFEHRRSYIQGIIRRYERMVLEQLNVHGGIPMLEYYPYVTLTRRVQELHDAFARALSMENAHEFQFQLPAQLGDDPETDDPRNFPAAPPVQPLSARDLLYPLSYNLPGDDETPELNGVISAPYEHQQPSEEGLLKHIIRGFLVNRDIFGGSVSDEHSQGGMPPSPPAN